jgi:fructokinase
VFFSDRVSRAAIELAKYFRKKGSLVFFEPSAAGGGKLFREMLDVCDVLKYSAQRARSFSDLLRHHKAFLEIETLGEDGLRFRTRGAFGSWHSVPAYEVKIKDTAGSGDWTSVGLISALFAKGRRNLDTITKRDISSSLEHGQALAALNCQFEGPRGAMYWMAKEKFLDAIARLKSKKTEQWAPERLSLLDHQSTRAVCPNCTKRFDRRPHSQLGRGGARGYSPDASIEKVFAHSAPG